MKQRMNIVIVGHVDHGKSTLIGRLLADTKSLPQGKLDQIKLLCEKNSKPFEYAFLLDSLKDEQSQGITIDTTRIFFTSDKREYIIIDAPGHIEFLKNMVSGAARAEAAILLIDAHEGIAENSKRHAYMLSFLGIKQIAVAVNKMDLVNYDQNVFENIKRDYTLFLNEIGIEPLVFIPTAARDGVNLINNSLETDWYKGPALLEIMDSFKVKKESNNRVFRMFAQGIYKFSGNENKSRVIAGTINSGTVSVGDEITYYPSGKKSIVKSIEEFNAETKTSASTGEAIGITLEEEIYVSDTELITKSIERQPQFSDKFKANVFWMGKKPLEQGKDYQIKIGTQKINSRISNIESVIDASELKNFENRTFINRHEVAQCEFETSKSFAFDLIHEIESTSRFVIIDDYDIAGGGIIYESLETKQEVTTPKQISDFELELNKLVRNHFPHWQLAPLEGSSDV